MSRRGAGEGTIYRRNDGRWEASVHLGYMNGKRRRRSIYGKTRREVQDKLAAALRDHEQGIAAPRRADTVGRFLERWLVDVAKPRVRPSTYSSYAGIVHRHLVPGLGGQPLGQLGPAQVQAFMNHKLAAGLSPRRVQYLHAVLRAALAQAVKWSLVGRNVAELVDAPRVPRSVITPLSVDHARALLAEAGNDRLRALYLVAVLTGLRQGEALGLRWCDVDLEARQLHVRNALQRVDGKLVLVEPKTERSRRLLALPDVVVAALREHRRRQLEERLVAGSSWVDNDYVFPTTIGTGLDAATATRAFQRALARAGLPRQRFHDLRHSAASFMLSQGVPLRVVMEQLGHSQISLTANLYSHVMPSLKREAADRMDAVLDG